MHSPIVITGMGMVSPLGNSVNTSWQRLVNGQSGISTIDRFDTSNIPIKIAGTVPSIHQDPSGGVDVSAIADPKEQRKMDQRCTDQNQELECRQVLPFRLVSTRPIKNAPWTCSRVLTTINDHDSIHDHVLNPFSILMWPRKRSTIDYSLGIEDNNVGHKAFPQQPTVEKTESFRSSSTHFSNCFF